MDAAREEELVTPYYLQMMRLNALDCDEKMLGSIATIGRATSADEVVELLRAAWRPRVMGAWFALLHDEGRVHDAVLDSLRSSAGSLTSPPLVVVAVQLVGAGAIEALGFYAAEDCAAAWGACGFAAAALEHLGANLPACNPTPGDLEAFRRMQGLAAGLRQ